MLFTRVHMQPDPALPVIFSATNKDYWDSGWSRGHMAPAGNYKHSQESMDDTFYLTNIVPQDIDNNGGLVVYAGDGFKTYILPWTGTGTVLKTSVGIWH